MSFIVPFKITLVRTKQPSTIHRFRGRYTFDEMQAVLCHLWGGAKKLVLQYEDDDGDRITIASECEWDEGVRLHSNRMNRTGSDIPFRLTALRQREPKEKASSRQDDCTCTMSEENTSVEATKFVLPPIDISKVTKKQTLEVHYENALDQAALELLSVLFHCDAAKELLDPFSPIDFAHVVSRELDPEKLEVHLDIKTHALRNAAIVESTLQLDAKNYEHAADILSKAAQLFPHDTVILYNFACALALHNNGDRAVEMLRQAVEEGYSDIAHLKADADLDSIRSHPAYSDVVAMLAPSQPPTMKTPRATSVTVASSNQPLPECCTESLTVEVEQAPTNPAVLGLLAIFPSITIEVAEELLARHNNNVHVVANQLLGL